VELNSYKIFVEISRKKTWSIFENPFITCSVNFIYMHILNLAAALPKNGYTTEKLIQTFPCQLPEEVRQNVVNLGVSKRYLVNHAYARDAMDEVELVDLCTDACQKVIQKSSLSTKDIGFFIAGYDANPFLSPGLSQLLVREIGFDAYVNHANVQGIASTAFPKALELARNYLATNEKDYALLCISGVSSYWFQNQVHGMKDILEISQVNKIKDEARRRMELRKWIATMEFFLFGDGVATAIVAREGENLKVEKTVEVTNIGKKHHLAGYASLTASDEPFKFGFYSNLGREIPDLGAEYTALALKRLLGRETERVIGIAKKWAVHTGSQKILNRIAETHGIAYEKIRESHEVLRDCGNLSGASLPFILEKIVSSGKLSKNDLVLMVGYGWGFSAAASLLEYTERRSKRIKGFLTTIPRRF
jgi:3-oxoacyl-[acyl-carrier-protein] synthase III